MKPSADGEGEKEMAHLSFEGSCPPNPLPEYQIVPPAAQELVRTLRGGGGTRGRRLRGGGRQGTATSCPPEEEREEGGRREGERRKEERGGTTYTKRCRAVPLHRRPY